MLVRHTHRKNHEIWLTGLVLSLLSKLKLAETFSSYYEIDND